MTTDIDPLSAWAYRNGQHPISVAVAIAAAQIETSAMIREERAVNPGAFPIFRGELSHDATARRVIGHLLDAGWLPPGGEETLFETDGTS
jgi:hypothetical protein